ncbi:hypothetical protein ASPZODRAFT_137248 [Penicilliopsis zonata CBS 506.65]|uniref:Caspase domain-containing protein n=1 Tax=Penicilliopsis zonata CBS 506.65 TaxID=1073090 RepID=A0A1L9S5K1_9EURO|nr:hypothetical protein ASPZODRAFT_137248 [Penicilliopsis zonata CBS 506.65]OJJ42433.1 hypothetical protein ASPZODRAFT_137248 [Penicilliopsis zonata CBS 506.65]
MILPPSRRLLAFSPCSAPFNSPAAREFVITNTDRTPGWSVMGVLEEVVSKAEKTTGRSVVMVHYAGHGMLGPNGNLLGVEGASNRRFDAQRCLVEILDLLDSTIVDTLFVFDCCYSFAACRAPEVSGRIVEIIGASDNTPLFTNSPPGNTLTAKLEGEIRFRQRQGHRYIEFADVVQTLRSRENAVKPAHTLRIGASSICLPLNGLNTINPLHIPPTHRAVFSVYISNDMSQQELDQFAALLRSFPRNASITLDGVYPTGSICLILSSAYAVYSKLAGMQGYRFIAEATGSNLLRQQETPGLLLKE